eukprot:scaffold7934_cov160-Cylindrotheca_fusiformis.AAC.2
MYQDNSWKASERKHAISAAGAVFDGANVTFDLRNMFVGPTTIKDGKVRTNGFEFGIRENLSDMETTVFIEIDHRLDFLTYRCDLTRANVGTKNVISSIHVRLGDRAILEMVDCHILQAARTRAHDDVLHASCQDCVLVGSFRVPISICSNSVDHAPQRAIRIKLTLVESLRGGIK